MLTRLAGALSNVRIVTFPGAGHVPHLAHPGACVEAITAFKDAA